MEKYQKFEACFANLGMEPVLSEVVFAELEEYVATLYGEKAKSADEARWKIFKKKHQRENKITDLSSIPPCTAVLHLHSKRANAVAYLWRNAANPTIDFPSLEENGWSSTGEIQWAEEAFPDDIEELLTAEDESDDEYEYGSDVESTDETY